MSVPDRTLLIKLHDLPVARLERRLIGPHKEYVLRFEPSFIQQVQRPVLSLSCRDWRLTGERAFRGALPPFLANLLPEQGSVLRSHIEAANGLDTQDDFALLEVLGQDLVGAITVEPCGPLSGSTQALVQVRETVLPAGDADPLTDSTRLRFSGGLAGMQLKFSVTHEERLSLPLRGHQGNWILKVPEAKHSTLPRAELAALEWARAVGFEVPEARVVDPRDVERIPAALVKHTAEALLVRRFDRNAVLRPIHMEELASVLNVQPRDKYSKEQNRQTYTKLARLVGEYAGPTAQALFFERVLFDVLVGNGDAHLKNWAFLFPDAHMPVLAPVYDVVPTCLYGYPPELALPWSVLDRKPIQRFDAITPQRIQGLAREVRQDPELYINLARALVQRALTSFHPAMQRAGLDAQSVARIERQLCALPLVEAFQRS